MVCCDFFRTECDGINNCINHFDEQNCSKYRMPCLIAITRIGHLLGAASETMIGPIVFGVTLLVMAFLVIIFMYKTDKHKRREMARRFSKACINSGRRLSTMFSIDRRVAPTTDVLNRSLDEQNIYRSVPIIYESGRQKNKEISFDKESESQRKSSQKDDK